MIKFASGFKNSGREGGLIRCIGELLRLQTESMAGSVTTAALAWMTVLNKIGSIEVQTGKGSTDIHGDAGFLARGESAGAEYFGLAVQNIVVVVAAGLLQLNKRLINMPSNGSHAAQVHWCFFNRFNGTKGNTCAIAGGVTVSKQGDFLP